MISLRLEMSKTGAWALEQQEREAEQGLKTYKITERYIKEDTWEVHAVDTHEALEVAKAVEPEDSTVQRVISTKIDYIETFDNLEKK